MEVYGYYDVVVVGGGASGTAAAIAAAREGAKTILIETLGGIGGMLNMVGPPGWAFDHLFNDAGEQIIGGFTMELYNDLKAMDCAIDLPKPENRCLNSPAFVDIDWGGLLLFEKCREAGVKLLLHTLAVDVLKEGDTVRGVVVENTSGRMAVMGKVIVEATGEGDIAARAGVPFTKINRKEEEIDPPSITFHMDGVDWAETTAYFKAHPDQIIPPHFKRRKNYEFICRKRLEALEKCGSILELVRDGVIDELEYDELTREALANGDMHPYGNLGHFFTARQGGVLQPVFQHTAQAFDCDTTDVTEYSWGEAETRRQVVIAIPAIRKYLPGFKNAYLTRMTVGMRTREGRHMVGDYQMQVGDVDRAAKFPDVMAKCAMNANEGGPFHSAGTPGNAMNLNPKTVRHTPAGGGSYDIPYRAFVPKKVEGMLLTGKLVSVSQDFKRDLLPDNIIWGQAAGTAAAVCVASGKTPRELEADVSEVQRILRENGAILDGVK